MLKVPVVSIVPEVSIVCNPKEQPGTTGTFGTFGTVF
jgi:hypothetical protein